MSQLCLSAWQFRPVLCKRTHALWKCTMLHCPVQSSTVSSTGTMTTVNEECIFNLTTCGHCPDRFKLGLYSSADPVCHFCWEGMQKLSSWYYSGTGPCLLHQLHTNQEKLPNFSLNRKNKIATKSAWSTSCPFWRWTRNKPCWSSEPWLPPSRQSVTGLQHSSWATFFKWAKFQFGLNPNSASTYFCEHFFFKLLNSRIETILVQRQKYFTWLCSQAGSELKTRLKMTPLLSGRVPQQHLKSGDRQLWRVTPHLWWANNPPHGTHLYHAAQSQGFSNILSAPWLSAPRTYWH